MKDIKVVYMGTPEFSLEPLSYLIENTNVVLVVTKKDAYIGRKKILTPSPVKEMAINNNIPVLTPDSLKKEYESILAYEPDLIITCAYGKILPKEILDYPKYGCINIHASLLPKLRGAAPIEWSIINGDDKTGITLMYMDEGMDTGDIIDMVEIPIKDDDNNETLHNKLSILGRKILEKNLKNIIEGNIKRIKQNDEEATYAPMIERSMEEVDFNNKVVDVYNKIRAFSPAPLCKTTLFNEEVKIVKSHMVKGSSEVGKIYQDKKSLGIGCLDGIIYLDIIKPVGKNNMNIISYLNGKK